jgi:hypothetical protein
VAQSFKVLSRNHYVSFYTFSCNTHYHRRNAGDYDSATSLHYSGIVWNKI